MKVFFKSKSNTDLFGKNKNLFFILLKKYIYIIIVFPFGVYYKKYQFF